MRTPDYPVAREKMVREQLLTRGITNQHILKVMLEVPRHLFVDKELGPQAYSAHSFPIGFSQTISQPFMVAYLTQELELTGHERILEIGTGSGYQAAVLAHLAGTVYSIERIPSLATKAGKIINDLGLNNVHIREGDGAVGWEEKAPFDRILLTAAAKELPKGLLRQLRNGGSLLGPVELDNGRQEIIKLEKSNHSFSIRRLRECSFVPLIRHVSGKTASDLSSLDTLYKKDL